MLNFTEFIRMRNTVVIKYNVFFLPYVDYDLRMLIGFSNQHVEIFYTFLQ